jgi:type I restriction enzyme R subunit
MTEFKQIIGRGTRVDEDYGKYYFTILDFRKATNNFADPGFDGMPVVVYNPKAEDDVITESLDEETLASLTEDNLITDHDNIIDINIVDDDDGPKKIYVAGVHVEISNERVQYI